MSTRTFTFNVVSSAAPAWYTGAQSQQWTALPNSTVSSAIAGWNTYTQGGIIKAYSGGILNTQGVHVDGTFYAGPHLVIWGGGHGDYSGNELYAYGPLNGAPVWRKITDPTSPPPANVGRDANGYPVSRHTYDSLVYVPSSNRMFSPWVAGAWNLGQDNYLTADYFDFTVTNPRSTKAWIAAPNPTVAGKGTVSGFDAANNVGWFWTTITTPSSLARFNFATATWTTYTGKGLGTFNPADGGDGGCAAFGNGLLVTATAGGIIVFDTTNPTAQPFVPTQTGAPTIGDSCGLAWDSVAGRFVLWPSGGKTLYFVTPPANPVSGTWAWSSVTPASGVIPAVGQAGGTYGRFQRVESSGIFGYILMNSDMSACLFWKD